jgi:hypothetical protein
MVGATRVVQHVGEMNLGVRLRRRDILWICIPDAEASVSARLGYPRQLRVGNYTGGMRCEIRQWTDLLLAFDRRTGCLCVRTGRAKSANPPNPSVTKFQRSRIWFWAYCII